MEQDFNDPDFHQALVVYNNDQKPENNELKYSKRVSFSEEKKEYYTIFNINNEETCHQLYFDVSNERIPLDTNVRKKFGFDKCKSLLEEAYLLFIYYDCFFHFRKDLIILKKIYNFHEAYLHDKIYDYIIYLAQNNNDSEHFIWFLSNPSITKKFF